MEGTPLYVLGPIICDIAPGCDHIISSIGATVSTKAGANFIWYVTDVKHATLPEPEDVKFGVIATSIGAYVCDIAKSVHNAEKDLAIANPRKKFDWENNII